MSVITEGVAVDGQTVQGHCVSLPEAAREMETDLETPPLEAVTWAVVAVATEPALATNMADAEPEVTVTEDGTERLELVEVKLTATPLEGAEAVSVTVQVALAPELSEVGEQVSELSTGSAAPMAMEAVLEVPL